MPPCFVGSLRHPSRCGIANSLVGKLGVSPEPLWASHRLTLFSNRAAEKRKVFMSGSRSACPQSPKNYSVSIRPITTEADGFRDSSLSAFVSDHPARTWNLKEEEMAKTLPSMLEIVRFTKVLMRLGDGSEVPLPGAYNAQGTGAL
jgi:hypothetical protein